MLLHSSPLTFLNCSGRILSCPVQYVVLIPLSLSSSPSVSVYRSFQNRLGHARGSWDMTMPSCAFSLRKGVRYAFRLQHGPLLYKPPHSVYGLCNWYSKASDSIASQGSGFFLPDLLSGSSFHIHKGRWVRWAFAQVREIFLSLHIGLCLEMTDPRYLKLFTSSSLWPFIFVLENYWGCLSIILSYQAKLPLCTLCKAVSLLVTMSSASSYFSVWTTMSSA